MRFAKTKSGDDAWIVFHEVTRSGNVSSCAAIYSTPTGYMRTERLYQVDIERATICEDLGVMGWRYEVQRVWETEYGAPRTMDEYKCEGFSPQTPRTTAAVTNSATSLGLNQSLSHSHAHVTGQGQPQDEAATMFSRNVKQEVIAIDIAEDEDGSEPSLPSEPSTRKRTRSDADSLHAPRINGAPSKSQKESTSDTPAQSRMRMRALTRFNQGEKLRSHEYEAVAKIIQGSQRLDETPSKKLCERMTAFAKLTGGPPYLAPDFIRFEARHGLPEDERDGSEDEHKSEIKVQGE
jgi:hypothetical protein